MNEHLITLVDLTAQQPDHLEQAAQILVDAFVDMAPKAWPTLADAREEVADCLDDEMICRAALNAAGEVVGWIGGRPEYDGNVWELHPLAVRPDWQGRGVGRQLVADLEAQVTARGAYTMMLGTDDENGMTSLTGVELYPDIWPHVASLQNYRNHPYSFYQKLGYVIVGLIPDANGPGKPDILMAKRLRSD